MTRNYATGKKTPRASHQDLEVDSPYNTYKVKGLPKGPIGNPGITAIQAAIYPKKHQFYYFINEQKEGKAYFAKTKEEHRKNVATYLGE